MTLPIGLNRATKEIPACSENVGNECGVGTACDRQARSMATIMTRKRGTTMSRIKQSLAWWCFGRSMAPEELIAQAARIGYAGVEMCPEEHWQKVVDGGLKIVTMGGHYSLSDGLNKRENHDRIQREIEKNLETAVKWGVPALIVFSGNRNGLPDAAGIEITAEGLQRVAKSAEDAGVTLVLE